jgi:NitT/TauT family transport system substrate-binding protein
MARFSAAAAAGALALAFTFVSPAPAHAQALKKVKVTIPVPALTFYPLYVGRDRGLFAKHGFDVEIIQTSGDGPDVDALISGSVDFTVSTPNRLFMAYEQGKPLLAVANLGNRMAIECWMNKEIAGKLGVSLEMPLEQRIKALKGLTVAGTRPGAFTYLLLIEYAKRFGLEPQKDVKIIGIGGPAAMIPAVENKQVAVACTGSPAPELAVARGKGIPFTNNINGGDPAYNNFLFELLYVRPDFAKSDADTVRRMIRGFTDAIAFIHDGPDAEHLAVLKKNFSGTPDDMLLAAMKNMRPIFVRDARITEESVVKAGNFMRQTGVVSKLPKSWTEIATNDYLPR